VSEPGNETFAWVNSPRVRPLKTLASAGPAGHSWSTFPEREGHQTVRIRSDDLVLESECERV
jgi:hypothetical protein